MHYYTCEKINLPEEVLDVPYAYTASAKNIYNSTLYVIRQIISAYEQVKSLDGKSTYVIKADSHDNVVETLELANQTIDYLSNKQKIKQSKLDKKEIVKKVQYHYEPLIDFSTYYQFLNSNILNNMLKIKDKSSNYKDYTQISSHIAQSAVASAIQDYKNYLASLKSFYKTPDKFLGKPKQPQYKTKLSRLTYGLDENRLTKDGYLARVITKDNILKFTSIKDKSNINQLYTCAEKKKLITNKNIDDYNNFSFTNSINKVVNDIQARDNKLLDSYNQNLKVSHKITSKIEFVSFKFIPNDKYLINGQPKVIVQAVLKHMINLPNNNLLAKILKINAKFLELNSTAQNEFIKNNFPKHDLTHKLAALDLGVVNHAAMNFNTGIKGLIISGSKYQNYVANKELELDKIKSSLIPQAVKDIQSHHDKAKIQYDLDKELILKQIKDELNKKEIDNKLISEEELKIELNKRLIYPALSKQDKALLNQTTINVYSNKNYINKLDCLNNYKKNYLHKLSNEIVDICVYHKMNYLIIGKNDLWKQNSNLGKVNNKNYHSLAHAKLIEYIRYKALLFGIVVLTTEESYTSKTSFINNSLLKKYSKSNKNNKVIEPSSAIKKIGNLNKIRNGIKLITKTNKEIQKIVENNQLPSGKSNPESILNTTLGGIRQSRGKYVNSVNEINKQVVIHADINGSYNMMRKIFTQMKYDKDKHCINYEIKAVESNKRHVQLIC